MDELVDKQLHNQVNTGNDVKDLADHPGFTLVMDSLKRDADEALEKLKVTRFSDIETIRDLQNIIWRHDEFASRMYTLISMGQEALQELIDGGKVDE